MKTTAEQIIEILLIEAKEADEMACAHWQAANECDDPESAEIMRKFALHFRTTQVAHTHILRTIERMEREC